MMGSSKTNIPRGTDRDADGWNQARASWGPQGNLYLVLKWAAAMLQS